MMKLFGNSETTPSVQALNLSGSNPHLLPRFVKEAHKNVSFKSLTGLWNLTNSTDIGSQRPRIGRRLGRLTIFFNQCRVGGKQNSVRQNRNWLCEEIQVGWSQFWVCSQTTLYGRSLFYFIFFSWEYPTQAGIGCNTMSKNDTANFLSFLQELRQNPLGWKLILSEIGRASCRERVCMLV